MKNNQNEFLHMENKDFRNVLNCATKFSESVLRPMAGEFDKKECIPKEIIREIASRGYLGAPIPVEFGGLGMDFVNYGHLTEIIGKGCSSTRAILTVHTSLVSQTILKLGTKIQKDTYLKSLSKGELLGCFALSEPAAGSDANAVQTTYEIDEDYYVINGKKKWITLGAIADLFLVIASRDKIVSAFIVDAKSLGVIIKPMTGLLGSRGAYIAEIEFMNVKVPCANMLAREGGGFSFVANTALLYGRYSVAWGALAVAQAALEEMASYSRVRAQYGEKIGQFQLIKAMIADAVTNIYAARALCIKIGEMLDFENDAAVMGVNIAKQFSARTAMKVTTDAVQLFGGNGCWDQYPVERLFREAKILEIIEGTDQIQQILIGKYGIKKYGKRKFDYISN